MQKFLRFIECDMFWCLVKGCVFSPPLQLLVKNSASLLFFIFIILFFLFIFCYRTIWVHLTLCWLYFSEWPTEIYLIILLNQWPLLSAIPEIRAAWHIEGLSQISMVIYSLATVRVWVGSVTIRVAKPER